MAENVIKLALYGQPAFEALARAKDADAALLYAFAAAKGGECAQTLAESELGYSAEQFGRAASLLRLYSLADTPPARAGSPKDIAETRGSDPGFANLCGFLEAALGRILRRAELETLYNVYGNLGLPAEVLVLLISFCKETHRLSAREIERQAYAWHEQGIDNYARAERFLESQRQLYTRGWAIRRLLGIQDRKPSDSENRYISDWTAKGIPDELISLAYDRTATRTGKLSWAYMDKILQSWREKGIKTAKQAEALDAPRRPGFADAPEKQASVEAVVRKRFDERRQRREEELKARIAKLTEQSPEFFELEKRRRLCASRLARAPENRRAAIDTELAEISRARLALLVSLGRPADWLDDAPGCAKCGDRGYIGAEMCECFKLECERERESRLDRGVI